MNALSRMSDRLHDVGRWLRKCRRILASGGFSTAGELVTAETELVYGRRRVCAHERIAVFSPVPPTPSGVATFTFKLHYAAHEWYDMFGSFDSGAEYKRQLEMSGDDFNVLPSNYFERMARDVRYKAKIYVIGNSPFHIEALMRAMRSAGEANRHLYLHEAMVIAAFFDYCKHAGITIESFLLRWYPEISAKISELPHCDFFDFCRENGVYGIRPLIRMTGIRSLIVNNKTCEDMVRADLPPEDRDKVSIMRRYLPLADIEVSDPLRQKVPAGAKIVGTFGTPNIFKGTDRIIDAVVALNERKIATYLVLVGFHAAEYVGKLPEAKRRYCIVPARAPDNETFWRVMKGVDVAVQLRLRSLGESSGCICELLGMDVPVVTNKGFVEAPFSDFVAEVSQDAGALEIADRLEGLFKVGFPHVDATARAKYGFRNAAVELFEQLRPNVSGLVTEDDLSLRPKSRKELLFDVSQLAYVGHGNVDRDGIYFVSINVLRGLAASGRFNLSFYCRQCFMPNLRAMRQHDPFWANFPISKYSFGDMDDVGCLAKMFRALQAAKVEVAGVPPLLLVLRILTRIIKIVSPAAANIQVAACSRRTSAPVDIYFSPMFGVPEFFRQKKDLKKYVIVYDAIPTLFRSEIEAWSDEQFWYNELLRTMDRQTHYFAISECTRRDLVRITDLPPECFTTMPIATANKYSRVEDNDTIQRVRDKYGIPRGRRYAFSLCSINFRKNLVHGAACFIEMVRENGIEDMVLALGGGGGDKFLKQVSARVGLGANEVKRYVVLCGYVKDEDVAALYSGCEFFIYPSLYEGFGMPPLEAMQCGAPVVTSNVSSLPEVVGDAAMTVDPKDGKALKDAMCRLAGDEALRRELGARGIVRAKMFSWDRTVGIIVNKMQEDAQEGEVA